MHQPAESTFASIRMGDTFRVERVFSQEDLDRFADLSGDFSPLHMDETYARHSGFDGRVVHGMLLATLFSNLVGMRIPGKHALYLSQELAFRRPVLAGEPVVAIARVSGLNPPTRTLLLTTEIRNAADQVVVSGLARVKVRDEEPLLDAPAATPLPHAADRKAVLVVGASGGVGSATARLLAESGLAVAVHYHQNTAAAERLTQLILDQGGTACAIGADLRDPEAANQLIHATLDRFGRLDGLVNAPLGELTHRAIEELTWDHFTQHLELQLKAVLHLCQAAHPHLRQSGGAVVNVLSQVVWDAPPPRMADYVAAKYALKGFSKALAVEWAAEAIRVNTVSPGLLRTAATEHLSERIFKGEAVRTPLRRLAEPEEIARAIRFLLGEEARFLTGIDLPITGGQTMT
ncbi:MAG: SDR family oxidoreductase [Magnetococcales bacterium]|nr:SDR family oxidoreductase [Magnetococcales bacterium]